MWLNSASCLWLHVIITLLFPPPPQVKGLDYRYTDNINFWLKSLSKLGLPKVQTQPYSIATSKLPKHLLEAFDWTGFKQVLFCMHKVSVIYMFCDIVQLQLQMCSKYPFAISWCTSNCLCMSIAIES